MGICCCVRFSSGSVSSVNTERKNPNEPEVPYTEEHKILISLNGKIKSWKKILNEEERKEFMGNNYLDVITRNPYLNQLFTNKDLFSNETLKLHQVSKFFDLSTDDKTTVFLLYETKIEINSRLESDKGMKEILNRDMLVKSVEESTYKIPFFIPVLL